MAEPKCTPARASSSSTTASCAKLPPPPPYASRTSVRGQVGRPCARGGGAEVHPGARQLLEHPRLVREAAAAAAVRLGHVGEQDPGAAGRGDRKSGVEGKSVEL